MHGQSVGVAMRRKAWNREWWSDTGWADGFRIVLYVK